MANQGAPKAREAKRPVSLMMSRKQGRNLQITNMAAKRHVQRVAAVGRELATENLQIDFSSIGFTDHGEY